MIDWYVVIAALALIPVVSLAFVGCVVDRSGEGWPPIIYFAYPAGLTRTDNGHAVQKIGWTYTGVYRNPVTDMPGGEHTNWYTERGGASGDPILGDSETIPTRIEITGSYEAAAEIRCTCHVTVGGGPGEHTAVLAKPIPDGVGPTFTLLRVADSFELV